MLASCSDLVRGGVGGGWGLVISLTKTRSRGRGAVQALPVWLESLALSAKPPRLLTPELGNSHMRCCVETRDAGVAHNVVGGLMGRFARDRFEEFSRHGGKFAVFAKVLAELGVDVGQLHGYNL